MARRLQQQWPADHGGADTASPTFRLRRPYAGGPLRHDAAFIDAWHAALRRIWPLDTPPDVAAQIAANAIADGERLSVDGALWLADALAEAGYPWLGWAVRDARVPATALYTMEDCHDDAP